MATFGKTDIGGSNIGLGGGAGKVVCIQTAPADLTIITKLSTYYTGGAGTQLKGIIHDVAGGDATNQLDIFTEENTDGPGWVHSTGNYDATALAGSPIAIGFHGESISAWYYDAGAAKQTQWNFDAYADGPTDPFGAKTDRSEEISVYATYTPAAAAAGADKTKMELTMLLTAPFSKRFPKFTPRFLA